MYIRALAMRQAHCGRLVRVLAYQFSCQVLICQQRKSLFLTKVALGLIKPQNMNIRGILESLR
jgi:hypothetical protein